MMKKMLTVAVILALTTINAQAQLFDNVTTNQSDNISQPASNAVQSTDLIDYMRDSKEMEADFKQVSYNQRGEEVSEGHMWIAKPNKFFWDYHTPYEQQIISDGKNVYHYDKDLEQITVRSKDELVGDVAIRLLEGQESLSDEFTIETVHSSAIPSFINVDSATAIVYSLTPKDSSTEYNAVWVVLENNELAQVIVDGGMGQQTMMTFNNLKRNHGIAASKFNFSPPQGVDIVGNIIQ